VNLSILHIITTIDLGGAENQLLTLATCQREAGFEVEVIFLKDKPTLLSSFLESDIKVNLSFAESGFLKQCLKLKQAPLRKNLVVHAHLPRAEMLCAFSLKPKSFVVTRHNSEPFFPKGPAILSKLFSRFVLKRAYTSISISKAVASYLKTSRELNSSETTSIIYYGLSDTTVSPKDKYEKQLQPIQIGTVSRLVPQKNLPLLLHTLQELNSMCSTSFELSVLGVGPLYNELQSLAMKLGVGNAVFWKGQTKNVTSFYRSLDAFVLPSNYEGFGLVLLEAMSQGIPVIARRISAIPEVMGEKHPGLVDSDKPADLARKIRELLEDNKMLNECLKYQATQLSEFSIKKTEIAHRRLYMRLIEQRKCVLNDI
jgi:glycosyltransferase involved in cell wall biosynthesis